MKTTNVLAVSLIAVFLVAGCTTTDNSTAPTAPLKEFSMDSFYTIDNGTAHPQFSVKDLTVNKGDRVRITITNIKGNHDFNIDEFNVHAETPLNQSVTVDFIADKSGDFVYYCSKPGHRAAGHWGTLHVV